jgi:hypothetical protein
MERGARVFVAANAVFIVWLLMTLTLMLRFNYTYAGSASADLGGGANLVGWLHRQSARGVAAAMFNEFRRPVHPRAGGILPGAAAAAAAGPPIAANRGVLRLRSATRPSALESPLPRRADGGSGAGAALPSLGSLTLAAFVVGNLRVGAQLPIGSAGKIALAASMVLGLATIVTTFRGTAS